MPQLIGITEDLKGETFPVKGPKATVGRVPDSTVRLAHETVSSRHAELVQQGDQWIVRDLNATNGTFVNGSRITEATLHDGDRVQFGYVTFKFLADAGKHATTAVPKEVVALSDTSARLAPPAEPAEPSPLPGVGRKKFRYLLLFSLIAIGLLVITVLTALIAYFLRS